MLTSVRHFAKCPARKSKILGMGLLLFWWNGGGREGDGRGAKTIAVAIGPFSSLIWNGAAA